MLKYLRDLFEMIFMTKGGKIMMAMLYVTRIIAGKLSYAEVPAKLKAEVADILKDSGLPGLIEE